MTIQVEQKRYDELIRKEALLESIEKLRGRMTDYAFCDAVSLLLKTEVKADE